MLEHTNHPDDTYRLYRSNPDHDDRDADFGEVDAESCWMALSKFVGLHGSEPWRKGDRAVVIGPSMFRRKEIAVAVYYFGTWKFTEDEGDKPVFLNHEQDQPTIHDVLPMVPEPLEERIVKGGESS